MKHYKDANTNEIYAYEADGSQDEFIKEGLVAITDAELVSIRAAQQAAIEATLTYAQKRAAEYPSFADQFDLLYHGGMDAWKAAIDVVKNKYPKV